jgi:DNA modification methylase
MTIFTNTVIKGDCTKALPMLHDGSIDLILTDPPYVRNYTSRKGRTVRA